MKQYNLRNVTLLAILTAVLIVTLWVAYLDYAHMQVIYYDSYGIISNRIGFDTSDERISFGGIIPGGSSTRTVVIENKGIQRTGYVYVRGNISPYVSVSESPFMLKPYENKTLVFLMSAPLSHYGGVYTGEFKIVLKGKG